MLTVTAPCVFNNGLPLLVDGAHDVEKPVKNPRAANFRSIFNTNPLASAVEHPVELQSGRITSFKVALRWQASNSMTDLGPGS